MHREDGNAPPLTSWAQYNGTVNGTNNNQLAGTNQAPGGVSYDASGDVLNDGVNTYLYDAEGRICAVASTPIPGMTVMTGYLYDAGGTRVAKGSITAWSCDPAANGFTTINDYVLGPGGEQVTEMGVGSATTGSTTSGLAWQHTNVWAGGKLLGTYDNDGLHFYLDDPLGTRRVQTDSAGVVEQTCQSLPYGDGLNCITPPNASGATYAGSLTAPTEHHFTGKERDAESGNDYFGARYYSSAMGRFMSPDWAAKAQPVPYAKVDDPQSLNLYAYVGNNPLTRNDADGHCGAKNDPKDPCHKVTVEIQPQNNGNATFVPNETVTGPNGPMLVSGEEAKVTYTVKENGKTVDGVEVSETNRETVHSGKASKDKTPDLQGLGPTKNGGQINDTVRQSYETDGSPGRNSSIERAEDSHNMNVEDHQTLLLGMAGRTCKADIQRNFGNIDQNGIPAPWHVSFQSTLVTAHE